MVPDWKDAAAGNMGMLKRSHKVCPVDENMKCFDLKKKEMRSC